MRTTKFVIENGGVFHKINSAFDLYSLYNDFASVYVDKCIEVPEIVEGVLDNYERIYKLIEHKSYTYLEFEYAASPFIFFVCKDWVRM